LIRRLPHVYVTDYIRLIVLKENGSTAVDVITNSMIRIV